MTRLINPDAKISRILKLHSIFEMIQRIKVQVLLVVFLAITACCCYAQPKQFQHITSADGLSQSEVYSFLEDSRGFMWFGTVDGLNRYDGYKVTIYNTDKNNLFSIPNNTVRSLSEDNLGRIWIGTDEGLAVYDSKLEKVIQVELKGITDRNITIHSSAIKEDQLYLGTSTGLLIVEIGSTDLDSIAHNVLAVDSGIEGENITICRLAKDGRLWYVTASSLFLLTEEGVKPVLEKVVDLQETLPDARGLVEDASGNLWITSYGSGLIRYNPITERIDLFSDGNRSNLKTNSTSSIASDKNGNLWVGTHDKGLLYLEKAQLNDNSPAFTSIKHDPYNDRSLNSNLIYSLYVSENNLLWIGTIGSGINIYNPNRKRFRYHNLQNATNQSLLSTKFARSVYADDDRIWVGTHNNGLYSLSGEDRMTIEKLGFGSKSVFHITDAGNGYVLVCTGSGISLVKMEGEKMSVYDNLNLGSAFYSTQVKEGVFWVATIRGVVRCRYQEGKITEEKAYDTESVPSVSHSNCRVLYHDYDTDELLVGTEGGGLNVIQLDENQDAIRNQVYKMEDENESINNNYIRSIIKASSGDIWIGTYEGLIRKRKDSTGGSTFKTYLKQQGFPNNTVQSIVEDNNGNLWIGTNQGLCRFDSREETFTQYTSHDGIQSNEFSEHTVYKKSDGEIIIGGINGINTFYPDEIVKSKIKSDITITDFYLFNKKVEVDKNAPDDGPSPLSKSISITDTINLDYSQNSFGFDFTAMNFDSPEKIQYAYMLEGFDSDWNITSSEARKATYTNLGYGDYTFSVKSTNTDGQWNLDTHSIYISIKTPFYLSKVAFLLYGIMGLLAFFFFTNYSVLRFKTKEKILLENQHNKKMRELEELRTRFFINVSHDLRTPLTLISSPLDVVLKEEGLNPDTKNLLSLMKRNVSKLKELTEQLLDFSKAEKRGLIPHFKNLDVVSFIKNEALYFEDAFLQKGIGLEVKSEEDRCNLRFDPDMLSKVVFNILSNALKYTKQGKVVIQLSTISADNLDFETNSRFTDFLQIRIEDTGEGIDEAQLSKVFDRFYQGVGNNKKGYGIGLSHTRDLVEAHNGKIDVSSDLGIGTVFDVFLPLILSEDNEEFTQLKPVIGKREMPFIDKQVESEPIEESGDAKNNLTILVVEDNKDLRHFIVRELRSNYQVLEASNGIEGLQKARTAFPDLILSDVMMPEMDGIEFCREIKTDLKTSHIPVVLLTAKVNKEAKYKGLEIGADDYISKPFDLGLLLLRIKNLIKNRERLRSIFGSSPNFEPSKVTVTSIDETFLTDLMAKIEDNISDVNFSIGNLEQEMGMSHSSFYNKIKGLTGYSAKELLNSCRMKRAKQIIEDTDNIRISEVAYMVGFSDPKYFSKRFKEHFGTSPSSFTKK